MSWTYSKAGVDLSKHRVMHGLAAKAIEELGKELGVEIERGGFAHFLRLGNLEVTLHADGVGTKSIVLSRFGRYDVLGWDCVAVNVNDIACEGARPLALVDYLAMPKSDETVFERFVKGLVDAARYSKVAIVGGETAILPDLVNYVDAVCFILGVRVTGFKNRAEEGDLVIGVESWGLHANGYTLVRRVIESTVGSYETTVDGLNLVEELVRPTAIYSNLLSELIEERLITSASHITGGGFSKIKRVLGEGLDAVLEPPKPPKIFEIIRALGSIQSDEMYRVFNMGIGLILTAKEEVVGEVLRRVSAHGLKSSLIGVVRKGSAAVRIRTHEGVEVVL